MVRASINVITGMRNLVSARRCGACRLAHLMLLYCLELEDPRVGKEQFLSSWALEMDAVSRTLR